jgi:hypothetical protein
MAAAIESDVRSVLTSMREDKIQRAYRKAWNDWWSSPDRPKLSRWDRTRANFLFECMVTRLKDEFADDSGARFLFYGETFKLIFDNHVIARFKKAGIDGMGSNVLTQAQMNWGDQQQDLPGFNGIQKIEIDYMVDVTGTEISQIIVLARNGKKKLWEYEIGPSEGGATLLPLYQPTRPVTPVESMVKERTADKPKESVNGQE